MNIQTLLVKFAIFLELDKQNIPDRQHTVGRALLRTLQNVLYHSTLVRVRGGEAGNQLAISLSPHKLQQFTFMARAKLI